jgi:hypothetical protein
MMVSFEMHHRDELGRRLLWQPREGRRRTSWRHHNRGCATRLTAATWRRRGRRGQRQSGARRRRTGRGHRRWRGHASTSTLPSYYADAGIIEDAQRHRQRWREEHIRRRLETRKPWRLYSGNRQRGQLRRGQLRRLLAVVGSIKSRISSGVYSV